MTGLFFVSLFATLKMLYGLLVLLVVILLSLSQQYPEVTYCLKLLRLVVGRTFILIKPYAWAYVVSLHYESVAFQTCCFSATMVVSSACNPAPPPEARFSLPIPSPSCNQFSTKSSSDGYSPPPPPTHTIRFFFFLINRRRWIWMKFLAPLT